MLLLACALSAGSLGTASAARAQEPASETPAGAAPASETDADPAVRLFREGRALLNKGRFSEACERFQASLELRRSPGTLLNVGNCIQSQGDLVGALAAFEETAKLSREEPDPRKAEVWSAAAREEIDALAPRVPRIIVNAPSEADVAVALDGTPLGAFGEPRTLNPGAHRLVASAPGKLDHQREITLAEGQSLAVDIPRLEPVPAAAPPAAVPLASADSEAAPTEGSGHSLVVPWTLVGVGRAALAGGLVTGLVAAQRTADLEEACPNHVCEDDLSKRDAAHDAAVLADILMGAGLAVTAAGVTWLVLESEHDTSSARLSAACDLHGCGASVRGRF